MLLERWFDQMSITGMMKHGESHDNDSISDAAWTVQIEVHVIDSIAFLLAALLSHIN